MPKGHSEVPKQILDLAQRCAVLEISKDQDRLKIEAIEKRLAEMDAAFATGYLPRPPIVQTDG